MAVRVDRIRFLLKEKGISANKMLSELNQSTNNLTRWEKGTSEASHASVSAIANYLGVDVRYLLNLSDSPYSDDLIEDMTDKMIDAGAEIWTTDDDEGVGQEYEIEFKGKKSFYHRHDFETLCSRLRMELNDSEIRTVNKFCEEIFGNDIPSDSYEITKEEKDLLEKYRKLSQDGKIIINAAIIQEIRREE